MDNLAIIVIVVSAVGTLYSCICRLTLTHRGVYGRVRNRYVIIGVGCLFAIFGGAIFPGDRPALIGFAIYFAANALGFWLDRKDWAKGVPESATIPGELYERKPSRPKLY
jgi:hypothetical protein